MKKSRLDKRTIDDQLGAVKTDINKTFSMTKAEKQQAQRIIQITRLWMISSLKAYEKVSQIYQLKRSNPSYTLLKFTGEYSAIVLSEEPRDKLYKSNTIEKGFLGEDITETLFISPNNHAGIVTVFPREGWSIDSSIYASSKYVNTLYFALQGLDHPTETSKLFSIWATEKVRLKTLQYGLPIKRQDNFVTNCYSAEELAKMYVKEELESVKREDEHSGDEYHDEDGYDVEYDENKYAHYAIKKMQMIHQRLNRYITGEIVDRQKTIRLVKQAIDEIKT